MYLLHLHQFTVVIYISLVNLKKAEGHSQWRTVTVGNYIYMFADNTKIYEAIVTEQEARMILGICKLGLVLCR